MGFITRLFGKAETAIAFVDFEYWYYSYQNHYGIKPDPQGWKASLSPAPADIMVFGEFSNNRGIADQLTALRTITNTIIETRQPTGIHKKDMTDFIMLDYIYQTAAKRPEISTYIIFTGDGHFQSVVKYLTGIGKRVIVCGVAGSFSSTLQSVASETVLLPDEGSAFIEYSKMILKNLSYAQTKISIVPTYNGTVGAVVRNNKNVSEELVRRALDRLLKEGLITMKTENVSLNKRVPILHPEWKKLHDAGMWED